MQPLTSLFVSHCTHTHTHLRYVFYTDVILGGLPVYQGSTGRCRCRSHRSVSPPPPAAPPRQTHSHLADDTPDGPSRRPQSRPARPSRYPFTGDFYQLDTWVFNFGEGNISQVPYKTVKTVKTYAGKIIQQMPMLGVRFLNLDLFVMIWWPRYPIVMTDLNYPSTSPKKSTLLDKS